MCPSKEQDTAARAAAKRAREVIMVTEQSTGRVSIRQRGVDSGGSEARSVYGGDKKTEPEPRQVDVGSQRAKEQGGAGLE